MKYSVMFLFCVCMLCLLSFSKSHGNDTSSTTPEDVGNMTETTIEDGDDSELFQRLQVEIFPLQRRRRCPPDLHEDRCPPRP
ncbi:unnamed protein product, partial [Larinioides sclopetarius]